MPKTWTVAVIGCGIGRAHIAEGYVPNGGKFRVLAICDIDEARLAAVGGEFAVPRRVRSLEEVLSMEDIDIIDICTPPSLHFAQTMAALAAGKQVVCEKPLTGSLAEVDRLSVAEQESRGRILPIYQYRYGNGVQKAKRIIDL